VLTRILVALALAAVLVSGGAVAFLRTDFVANNLCAYAVATIEEATAAKVNVARCEMLPESGRLTIEGLTARDPNGRIELKVARIFAQVKVRPILQRVKLERLEVDYPELKLSLDVKAQEQAKDKQCLPDVIDRFEFGRVQVRKASADIRAGDVHVQVPRATVRVNGDGGQLAVSVSLRGGKVELPGRTIGLVSVRTEGSVDLRGAGAVEVKRADLIGTEASAFVKGALTDLCRPHIEAQANVHVDDLKTASERLIPGLLDGVSGGLAVDASLTMDPGKVHVKGDLKTKALTLVGLAPGEARLRFDVTPQRLKVEKLEVPFPRGLLAGTVQIDFKPDVPFATDLNLREVELAEILRKVGLPGAYVEMRSTGRVQAKGSLAPLHLEGDANLDLADFAVLDRAYEQRANAKRMFEFPRGHVTTALSVNRDQVELRKVTIDVGNSRVFAESTFYTDVSKGMLLLAHSETLRLDDFKDHIGPLPMHGLVGFEAHMMGPYRKMVIAGTLESENTRLLELKLGEVGARIGFETDTLRLTLDEIEGLKDRTHYRGRIALDFGGPEIPVDAHIELPDAYLHDLVDLSVGLVPRLASISDEREVDGHVSGVLDAKGPVASPDATAKLLLEDVGLWGERFDRGTAHLTLHGGSSRAPPGSGPQPEAEALAAPRLQIDQLALEHGDARVKMSGRFGPLWQLDMDAHSENFDLADLDQARAAKLTGPLSATAHIGGVAAHPEILANAKFTGGKAGRAALGDGDLLLTVNGEAMKWTGVIGTHVLQGEATLAGEFPYTSAATVRIPELHKYLELKWPDAGLESGSLAAQVAVKGSLLKWRQSTGTVTVSKLKVTRNEMEFENDGPVQIDFGPQGIGVDRLNVRSPYTSAQLSGRQNADGKLSLRLSASIDGRLLPALLPDVEHGSGTYLVQATVSGTADSPVVLGNLRLEDVGGSLRGIPLTARALNGSISFSQDALVIDSLAGKLNNGEARVSGGMEMKNLVPQKVDFAAHITETNVKLRDDLAGTIDGDLTLFGPPLEPTLGGSVIVSHMKYTEELDIERSLLDFLRRPPAPKVLTKSALTLHLDLDVHLSRGVRLENNLARTDLKGDLKITGTSRAMGLLGSINTVHGTAQFRGNEFQIEQGVLSFTDRQRIRPSFDLQANARIKTAQTEYKIELHAFGTPEDPHLQLLSDPSLAEADLGFLLTFGFVSTQMQQASFSANDAGLALGVEALNKVTGFSEEVRRFIPKNQILRDPNIDFASDFSVATNRLEPMARFSSHLVTDRLDLKVLEGLTTRRYRSVLSYQLSDALSTRLTLDNEHIYNGVDTDFGVDLHYKWEGE
jgi:autotransporter translocation and assembly factor TamB